MSVSAEFSQTLQNLTGDDNVSIWLKTVKKKKWDENLKQPNRTIKQISFCL